MRGSPFLMPVYGAGVAFWQECAAVKSGMLHGGVCGVRVRLGGVAGCIAAGVGALPLVLASGGLCGKRGGGCWCVGAL